MHSYEPDEGKRDEWHRDPNNWFWGIFYYNPQDKRVFVLKRVPGMGFTLNFAHRISHVIFALILFMVFLLIWISNR